MYVLLSSLVIRGDKDEHAVLCSGDKTYDLKIADTSNLLMFVPGLRTPDQLTDGRDNSHVVHTQVWEWQIDTVCYSNTVIYTIFFLL